MENNHKETFCMSCYVGKYTIGNDIYNKYICCMYGHENKEAEKNDGNNRRY